MKDKQIITLDLAGIISGAKYRGDFESKLKSILKEVEEKNGKVILFIDEFHLLMGLGKAEGSIDASNLLKPALARVNCRCVEQLPSKSIENMWKRCCFSQKIFSCHCE